MSSRMHAIARHCPSCRITVWLDLLINSTSTKLSSQIVAKAVPEINFGFRYWTQTGKHGSLLSLVKRQTFFACGSMTVLWLILSLLEESISREDGSGRLLHGISSSSTLSFNYLALITALTADSQLIPNKTSKLRPSITRAGRNITDFPTWSLTL